MKKVYVAQSPAEAHLVRGWLENEGIPVVVQGNACVKIPPPRSINDDINSTLRNGLLVSGW